MLMFSRKGLAAFIGIGILLGPSDGLKCYECAEDPYKPCARPKEKDCPEYRSCLKFWKPIKGGEESYFKCGDKGTAENKPTECYKLAGEKTCICFSNLCNTVDLKWAESSEGPGSPSGVSKTTASSLSWVVFGILILAYQGIQQGSK